MGVSKSYMRGWLADNSEESKIKRKIKSVKESFIIRDPGLIPRIQRTRIAGSPKSVYLAGPMEGCTYEEASEWRQEATHLLKRYGIKARNPIVRDFREAFAKGLTIPPEIIVEPDKADILQSDAVLVWYSDKTTGTAMEILYAYYWFIPVVVVAIKKPVSPWVVYHAEAIVDTLEEAIEYIRAYDISK